MRMKSSVLTALLWAFATYVYGQGLPSYVPVNGLVGWWGFSGNANDAGPNANHGTVKGPLLTTDRNGNPNSAYAFDGVDDWIEVANHASVTITGDITLSAWVNTAGSNGRNYHTILSKRETYWTSEYGMALSYHSGIIHNGKLIASRSLGMGNQQQAWSSASYLASTWQMWTVVMTAGTARIYRNGVLDTTMAMTLVPNAQNCPLLFGRNTLADNTEPFFGKMDDIGIWSRALTPQEISQLYAATNPSSGCSISNFNPLQDTTRACGTSANLNAGSGFSSYVWNTGANSQSVSATSGGWYKVAVSNSAGCTGVDSTYLSIVDGNIDVGDTVICKPTTLRLSVPSNASSSDQWVRVPSPADAFTRIVKTNNGRYLCAAQTSSRLYASTDLSGFSAFPSSLNTHLFAFGKDRNGILYYGTSHEGVFRSADNANTWNYSFAAGFGCGSLDFETDDQNNLYVGVGGSLRGLHVSKNNGATWVNAFPGRDFTDIQFLPVYNRIFIINGGLVWVSSNAGTSWTQITGQPFSSSTIMVKSMGSAVYIFTNTGDIYSSVNGGSAWSLAGKLTFTSTPSGYTNDAVLLDNMWFVSVDKNGVYRSTNNGQSWVKLSSGISGDPRFLFYDNGYLVATTSTGIFKLQAGGSNTRVRWSTGDTTNAITVSPTSANTYAVTVTDGITTCTDSVRVTVSGIQSFNPLPDTTIVCGLSSTLQAGTGYSSYRWSSGASSPAITATASGWYKVNVSNAAGCSAADSTYVDLSQVDILQSDTTICRGSTVTLRSRSTGAKGSMYVSGASPGEGGAVISNATNILPTGTPKTYECTFRIEAPVPSGTNTTIWVFGPEPLQNCRALGLRISSSQCGSNKLWLWGHNCPEFCGPTIVPNTTYHCVTVVNGNNVKVYLNGVLQMNSNMSVSTVISNKFFIWSAWDNYIMKGSIDDIRVWDFPWSQTDVASAYANCVLPDRSRLISGWDFNQGSLNGVRNIKTGADDIDFLAKVTISNQNTGSCSPSSTGELRWSTGDSADAISVRPLTTTTYYLASAKGAVSCRDSVTIRVSSPDTSISAVGSPSLCSSGGSVMLNAGSAASYQWLKNGTVINAAVSATYAATSSGDYRVIVKSQEGCQDTSRTISVNLKPSPLVSFGVNDSTQCLSGNDFRFTNRSSVSSGTLTYQWDFGNGSSSTLSNPSVTYTAVGTYRVRLRVNTDLGCTDTLSMPLSVLPSPPIPVVGGPDGICPGQTISLSASGAAPLSWYRDGSILTASGGNTLSVSQSGSYRVMKTDAEGCTAESAVKTVSAYPAPQGVLSVLNSPYICEGRSTTLYASGASGYQWYLNSTAIVGANSDTLKAAQAGIYTVEFLSDKGCRAMGAESRTLSLIASPLADFTVDGGCKGVPVLFRSTATPPVSGALGYRWSFGDGSIMATGAAASHTYARSGTFTVSLSVTQSLCPSQAWSVVKTLRIDSVLSALRYPSVNVVVNKPFVLEARNIGSSWQWSPPFQLTGAGTQKPVFQGDRDQQYLISIRSASGCLTVDTLLVRVVREFGIHVPGGFTPDGDGRNDKLYPIPVGIREMRIFKVFNRWGMLLFDNKAANAFTGWDGTFQGKLQPMETYAWIAEGVDMDGKVIRRTGNVILIR